MGQKLINEADLSQVILSYLHALPPCKTVRGVSVKRTPASHANWTATLTDRGESDPATCETILEQLVEDLQGRYQLS